MYMTAKQHYKNIHNSFIHTSKKPEMFIIKRMDKPWHSHIIEHYTAMRSDTHLRGTAQRVL